jgi:hypothetical protein
MCPCHVTKSDTRECCQPYPAERQAHTARAMTSSGTSARGAPLRNFSLKRLVAIFILLWCDGNDSSLFLPLFFSLCFFFLCCFSLAVPCLQQPVVLTPEPCWALTSSLSCFFPPKPSLQDSISACERKRISAAAQRKLRCVRGIVELRDVARLRALRRRWTDMRWGSARCIHLTHSYHI